jgi:methylase of polypeptide subunit release factors
MTTSYRATAAPLTLDVLGDLEPLRKALAAADYTPERVAGTLEIKSTTEIMDLPMLVRRTAKPTHYHTLFRLFMLGQRVPDQSARQALAPASLASLLAGGLLQSDAKGVYSAAKLVPHTDLILASDFTYPARSQPVAEDHVLGVGPASITLSVMTVRKPVEAVLDVGCGAGIQSVLSSRHARRVVGADISSRALNFAAFNSRINGITNVTWRAGSFFEPVADETFDLVVANPPFVISPASGFMYRDSGMGGDAVSEHVLKGAAARLREGGFASVLVNWHHHNEDDWTQRPSAWAKELGCDAWIVRSGVASPLAYAASWLRFNEARDPERYGKLLDEWLAYYDKLGIGSISAGAVVLHKRSGVANWVRCDTVDDIKGSGQCGDSILRVFAAEDFLRQSEAQLLEQRLILHPAVTASQKLVVGEGGWTVESLLLNLSEGFPFSGKADIHILRLLANCDGRRTAREAIQALANTMETHFDSLLPSCLLVIKKMLRSGMLVFSGDIK